MKPSKPTSKRKPKAPQPPVVPPVVPEVAATIDAVVDQVPPGKAQQIREAISGVREQRYTGGSPGEFCERPLDRNEWPPRHRGVQCRGLHADVAPPARETIPHPLPEITVANQDAFVSAFRMVGTVRGAARISGVGRTTHYDWMETDPKYRKRFDHAREEYADLVDDEMHERGIVGWEEPVIGRVDQYTDGVVTYVRKKSDAVLLKLAAGVRPEKYARTRHEHTGKDGAPLLDLAKLTDEELVALRGMIAKAGAPELTVEAEEEEA